MDKKGRPSTIDEALEWWDKGMNIPSVSMGGIGPGYEQCIQVLVFELLRDCKDIPLPEGAWDKWGEETICRLDVRYGFSGAQVGAARNLAYNLLSRGWAVLDDEAVRDRLIIVSSQFPSTIKELQ